jgi:hypothetical protein
VKTEKVRALVAAGRPDDEPGEAAVPGEAVAVEEV